MAVRHFGLAALSSLRRGGTRVLRPFVSTCSSGQYLPVRPENIAYVGRRGCDREMLAEMFPDGRKVESFPLVFS